MFGGSALMRQRVCVIPGICISIGVGENILPVKELPVIDGRHGSGPCSPVAITGCDELWNGHIRASNFSRSDICLVNGWPTVGIACRFAGDPVPGECRQVFKTEAIFHFNAAACISANGNGKRNRPQADRKSGTTWSLRSRITTRIRVMKIRYLTEIFEINSLRQSACSLPPRPRRPPGRKLI